MTTIESSTESGPGAPPWHLSGKQAPVFDEVTLTELEVKGSIPSDLRGRYFRNGPNPQTGVSPHWFFGDGMLHGVELADGRANWYRNRYIRTPLYASPGADRFALAMNHETFAMDYRVTTANTHVMAHAGRILAVEEAGFPYEISPQVDTIGPCDFDGRLTTPMTAHPKVCPQTGEMLFFGYGFTSPYLTYHRVDAAGLLVQSEPITMGGPTMVHDFAISRNYAIFMDLPAVFDMDLAIAGDSMPIRWDDAYRARFGIMARSGTDADVRWFDVDPCYVFHTLNAYEDGDRVVVHGFRVPELWRSNSDLDLNNPVMNNEANGHLHEWSFDLTTGRVEERQLDDQPADFPRLAESLVGDHFRYGYAMALMFGGDHGEVLKFDFADGAAKTAHQFPFGHHPGEPSFAPAENPANEDDGWLLTFVLDETTDTSYLAVLDASDLSADPVAEIHVPRRIPTGFHGSWIPDAT